MSKRPLEIVIAALFVVDVVGFVWLRTLPRDYGVPSRQLLTAAAGQSDKSETVLAGEAGLEYVRLYDKHSLATNVGSVLLAVNGAGLLLCLVILEVRRKVGPERAAGPMAEA